MNIRVDEVASIVSWRYPYTHRVKLCTISPADDEVCNWLNENKIPYTQTGRGVFYLNQQNTELLLLKWA